MKNKETLQDFINEELEDVFFTNISKRREAERLIELGANWQAGRMYNEEDMLRFTEWISDNDWVYLPSKNYWVNEEEEESEKFFSTKELFGEWFQNYKK